MALVWAPYTPLPFSSLPHHPIWGPDSREFLSKFFSDRNWKLRVATYPKFLVLFAEADIIPKEHISHGIHCQCAVIHCPLKHPYDWLVPGAYFSSLSVFFFMDAGYLQCLGERRKSDWQWVYFCQVRAHVLLQRMKRMWGHVPEFSRNFFLKSSLCWQQKLMHLKRNYNNHVQTQ